MEVIKKNLKASTDEKEKNKKNNRINQKGLKLLTIYYKESIYN